MRIRSALTLPWYLAVFAIACFAGASATAQTTLWVDNCPLPGPAANTPGAGTQGNPYCKIQNAICTAKTIGGTATVNVLPGTYAEALRIPANVTLISTDGPAATILNAANKPCVSNDFCNPIAPATANCTAVYFPSAAGTTSRIEGFRIQNGGGIDQPCCAAKIGGGITVYGSSPTITRNEIVSNTISSPSLKLYYGAGIYVNGLDDFNPPRPVITNNLIQGNTANPPAGSGSVPSEGQGAGIYVGYNSAPIIEGNTIKGNHAGSTSTNNHFGAGGGISIYSLSTVQTPKVSRNYITGNDAADYGAGISFGQYEPETGVIASRAIVDSNIIELNVGVDGGGIGLQTTKAKIYNNTIHKNSATFHGAGIVSLASANAADQPEIVNNILSENQATGTGLGGGLYVYTGSNPLIRTNDLWQNTPTNVAGAITDPSVIGVNGNVSLNPGYTAPLANPPNYRLLPNSPLRDIGDNAYAQGPDFDGSTRVSDGDGNGTAIVDLGAFELSADSDGDGIPDGLDPDDDNDGVNDASDCAPLLKGVTQIPAAVNNSLRVGIGAEKGRIVWNNAFQGHTYNIYKGTFGNGLPFSWNETCQDTERTTRSWQDAANPLPGRGFFYLVSAKNTCGETVATPGHPAFAACGTVNQNSDGDPPPNLGDNCPVNSNGTQGDVDADFVGDVCDNCPSLFNVDQADPDGDLRGSACDNCPNLADANQNDTDTDGLGDPCDNCVSVSNPGQQNLDGDALGDACDPDDDNDTVADTIDNCPTIANASQADPDGDGRGSACDNCPNAANLDQADGDSDGAGDACDNCASIPNANQLDADGDLIGNACDNCVSVANPGQSDGDSDSFGDACDNCPTISNSSQGDGDFDGVGNVCDNCPNAANAGQQDGDTDTVGDACDNCPALSNTNQLDGDFDTVGNVCDNCASVFNTDQLDDDVDTVGNACDNCASVPNTDQLDGDVDNVGNVCDNCASVGNPGQEDGDTDTVGDICDNCAADPNTSQADFDTDNLGDVCDPDDDNDGVSDLTDCAPFDAALSAPPIEVADVQLSKVAGTTVQWTSGGPGVHDVASGSIATLRSDGNVGGATCEQDDQGGTSWIDGRPNPDPGDGYYYLVRRQNICGAGSYGAATGGGERIPAAACP